MNRERPNDPKNSFNPEAPPPINEELAKRILSSMKKAYTGEETVRWLANMSQELPVEPAAPTKAAKTQWLNMRAVSLLDKLFDDFQRYTFEFNKTISDPECRVQCDRPKPMHVPLGRDEEPIVCQGHLSTAVFAMILQPQEHTISAYIIPIDFLLGFNTDRARYKPYLVMDSDGSEGTLSWTINKQPINADVLSTFTKKVFAALIRVLNGEADLEDSFEWDGSKPVPTTTSDFSKQPQRPGFEEEFALQRPDAAAGSAANPAPAPAQTHKLSRETARPAESPFYFAGRFADIMAHTLARHCSVAGRHSFVVSC